MPPGAVGPGDRMRVTVGVLGAGSLFGQGIIKALRASTLEVRIVGLDAFPYAVGLYWADAAHVVPDVLSPEVTEAAYLDRLIEILKEERVELLFVATDFDVSRMSRHQGLVESRSGCKVVVSPPAVVDIADDKWATYQFLSARGLPCPPSLIELSRLDEFITAHGFPLVVKPRRGARSRGMSVVQTRAQLPAALAAAGPDPIVQVEIGTPEREYTCGAVVFERDCFGTIAMRRDLRDGNTFRAYLKPEPELEALTRQAALALAPYGPANFQLRLGASGPAIFEINARFSGTTVIRTLAGFNEVEAAARWVLFRERLPLAASRSGVVLRYWEELFVPWEAYERVGATVRTG